MASEARTDGVEPRNKIITVIFPFLSLAIGTMTVCYQVWDKDSGPYPWLITLMLLMFAMTTVIPTLFERNLSEHPSSGGVTDGALPSTDTAPTSSEDYNPTAKLDEVLRCVGEMKRGGLGREKLIEDLRKRAITDAARADKADADARSANERAYLRIAEAYNTAKRAAMNAANTRKEIATGTKRIKELELEVERNNLYSSADP